MGIEVGKRYRLNSVLAERYGRSHFVAARIDNTSVYDLNDVFVCHTHEHVLCEEIPYIKPFKVGATYKLKKKYVDQFYFAEDLHQMLGDKVGKVFTFTPTSVCENNFAYVNALCVATAKERIMFTRVDNK